MEPTAPRRRFRWWRRLLWLALMAVVLLLLAPTLIAPLIRRKVVQALAEQTGAEVSLEEFSLTWSGRATLEGLIIGAQDGTEHLTVGHARARVDLMSAVRGRILVDVRVHDWTARARRRADGSWSFDDLMGQEQPAATHERDPLPRVSDSEPETAPEVAGSILFEDGILYLEDGEQRATCEVRRAHLDLDGLDRPSSFKVSAQLEAEGPLSLDSALIELAGHITAAPASGGGPQMRLLVTADGRDLALGGSVGDFELTSDLSLEDDVLRLDQLDIESPQLTGTLRGRLEGIGGDQMALREVRGDFTYLPDALGALLGPDLPATLKGSELERLELTFDGPLASFELEDVLATCSGSSSLGIGTVSAFGIEATGGVGLNLDGGQLELGGELEAAGGALELSAQHGPTGSSLKLRLDGAQASAQLAPLLGELHPAFAGLDQVEGAGLEGLIVAELELSIDGPVSLSGLREGFDLSKVRGRGSLALDQARLRGSPFLSELLTSVGASADTPLDLAPMSFVLDGGRLSYDEPWRWRIDGVNTFFSGGLTLDGGLDLVWEVPITPALVKQHSVLAVLEGGRLSVPLGGSLGDPKLDWSAALEGVAEQALARTAAKELEKALEKELGSELGKVLDLDGLLGGGDAQAIYEEANGLWKAGRKGPASRLYQALKDDHRISPVYLLNKSRIDERRRWKPKK